MRRPTWFRALVGLWGLWFTAALLEAPGVHACAIHSHGAAHDHAHAAAAMHMSMAMHAEHGTTSPSDTPKEDASCTCLGLCCCASPTVVRSPEIELAAPRTIATATSIEVDLAAPAVVRPYERPYANGPPATNRVA